jgi:mono/diheme cytochrome c family protein
MMGSNWKLTTGMAGGLILALGLLVFSLMSNPKPQPAKLATASPVALATSQPATTTGTLALQPTATVGVVTVNAEGAAQPGAALFRTWCNSCHPNGQEGYGPALWGNGANWSPEIIRYRIRHTSPRERDRFATLSDEKLNDIIAYIQAQQRANN